MITLTQQRLWGNVKTCTFKLTETYFVYFKTCLSVCSTRQKIWQWKKLHRKFPMLQLVVTITHLIVSPGKCCYCLDFKHLQQSNNGTTGSCLIIQQCIINRLCDNLLSIDQKHRLNMELDLQSLFGLHVHSCTHWPLRHPHFFGLIYEGAIGQPR